MNVTYSDDVAVVIRGGRRTMVNVAATAQLALDGHLGRPTSADVVALAAGLQDARRPRCAAIELPDDHRQVLVELKPARKNSRRPVFAVARYFRPQAGFHDGEPGWFNATAEDVDVVRWWPIAGEVAP